MLPLLSDNVTTNWKTLFQILYKYLENGRRKQYICFSFAFEQCTYLYIEVFIWDFNACLYWQIVPSKCRYEVLSTKIEIRLAKAEPIQWTSLEYVKDVAVVQKINISTRKWTAVYCQIYGSYLDWCRSWFVLKSMIELIDILNRNLPSYFFTWP